MEQLTEQMFISGVKKLREQNKESKSIIVDQRLADFLYGIEMLKKQNFLPLLNLPISKALKQQIISRYQWRVE